MKSRVIWFIVVPVLTVNCTSMNMAYEADLQTEQGPAHFTYERTYKTRGYAWACGLTAIFYGGWCWFYFAKPKTSDKREIMADAQEEIRTKYHLDKFEIRSEFAHKRSWDDLPTRSNLVYLYPPKPSAPQDAPEEMRTPTSGE